MLLKKLLLIIMVLISIYEHVEASIADKELADQLQSNCVKSIIKGKQKEDLEDTFSQQGCDSQSPSSLNRTKPSEDLGLESEGEQSTIGHFFNLKEKDEECGAHLDSRSVWNNFSIHKHSFEEWHKEAIADLKRLTPQIRKALTTPNTRFPVRNNLLLYRIDLILPDSEEAETIAIENNDSIWVSGWPGEFVKKTLRSKFPERQFMFIDDLLPEEHKNSSSTKKATYLQKIFLKDYCFEKYGYLIKERGEYISNSLKRAERDPSHFNQHFLHTEQGLLKYLSSQTFQDKLGRVIQDKNLIGEIAIIINIASTNSVCFNCADRIFRESEWGNGFLANLREKLDCNLKLHFFVSAFERYTDDLKMTDDSKTLRDKLAQDKKQARKMIGFDGTSRINFMQTTIGRQNFNYTLPHLAHTIIEGNE